MTLLDMVRDYQSLLERKEELADEVKANNALIEEAKANISQQMIDDDCPSISVGGFKFTLTPKTIYSKKSEAELASEGINFFETLREEGLGDIIVESVNTRTLQSTIKASSTCTAMCRPPSRRSPARAPCATSSAPTVTTT